jgi:hypothetical protein
VCLSCVLGVVAQPLRRAETLAIFWFLCGPFAARGAKGEAEYLSRWLGGTGELSAVGKRERQGARDLLLFKQKKNIKLKQKSMLGFPRRLG